MASISLQPSGQISLGDIQELFNENFAATNISLRALSNNCGFSTPDNISDFYGYTIEVGASVSTLNYDANGTTLSGSDTVTITVSGGINDWDIARDSGFASYVENHTNNTISVSCDYNSTGSARTMHFYIYHADNHDCIHTITINQSAVTPTLTISPSFLTWAWDSTSTYYTQVTLNPDATITVTPNTGTTSHWNYTINQSLNRVYFTPTFQNLFSGAIQASFTIGAGSGYPTRSVNLTHEPDESCFVEGTLITLPSGEQTKIENLIEEQSIQSALIYEANTNNTEILLSWNKNELNYEKTLTKVRSNNSYIANETIIINNGLIEATPEHIQLIKSNDGWKLTRFKNIKEGDILYTINDEEVVINSIKINNDPRKVYKLSLYNPYMYYANNILTHNIK